MTSITTSTSTTTSNNNEEEDKEKENMIKEADFLNVCGTKYQDKNMYTKAISLYRRALKCVSTHKKTNFNMGTCLCVLGNKQELGNDKIKKAFYKKAIKHYEIVIQQIENQYFMNGVFKASSTMSTTTNKNDDENDHNAAKEGNNAYIKNMNQTVDMYASSLLNIAALWMKFDELDIAYKSISKILEFNNKSISSIIIVGKQTIKEAYYNLNSILRRMGKKDEAIVNFRNKMNMEIRHNHNNYNNTITLEPIDVSSSSSSSSSIIFTKNMQEDNNNNNNFLAVICVKWGTKYGLDYLINLYTAVETNLSIPHNFYCLTDNVNDLGNNKIIGIELEKGEQWTGWWNKATLFSERVCSKLHEDTKRVLYIDLDTVIIGSLDKIVCEYNGLFSILSTKGLDNEGKDFTNGYNSSIIMWNCQLNKSLHETIYQPLLYHMNIVQNFIYRFDHWLEMNIENADLLQDLYPNTILEYRHDCKDGKLPEHGLGCIVNFPLKPKPHEVVIKDPWVAKYWLAENVG